MREKMNIFELLQRTIYGNQILVLNFHMNTMDHKLVYLSSVISLK